MSNPEDRNTKVQALLICGSRSPLLGLRKDAKQLVRTAVRSADIYDRKSAKRIRTYVLSKARFSRESDICLGSLSFRNVVNFDLKRFRIFDHLILVSQHLNLLKS